MYLFNYRYICIPLICSPMRLVQYILILLSLVIVSCSTPEQTIALIDRAERVAIDYPDSALMLIKSVDSKRIRGKQDMAHYRLVMSEALYYNNVDSDCDSLTRPLFDYYYESDRHEERARAMYQHGLVMNNAGNNAEAMYALMEAEKSLQCCDNPRLLGLVYRTMGDIYGRECLYRNALTAYMRAYDVFNVLSLEFHLVYSLLDIGEIYIKLNEYNTAEEYLMSAIEKSSQIGCEDIYCYVVDKLCDLYVCTSRFVELEQYVDILDGDDLYEGFDLKRNLYKAILYSFYGNEELAIEYLCLADACDNPNTIEVEYLQSIVYQNLGNTAKANYWLQQNKIQQEELLLNILELPILNAQIEILKQDIYIAKEHAQNVRYRNIIVFLLSLFVAIAIAGYVRHRMIVQRHEIEGYISMISELKKNYEDSSSEILAELQSVYGNKLADLNNLLEVYYEHANTSRESYKIVEQVKSIVDAIRNDVDSNTQLERLVNLYHNNIVASIKSSGVRLSDKEQKYVVYMLSGFSNRSICLLLDINDAALYRIKYKAKSKLLECGLADEVMGMFARK